MLNILIIGNSPATVAAIKEIRRVDEQSTITVFSPEKAFPYNRAQLPALVAKDIKESQLFLAHEKFFKEQRVNFIHHEVLTRISLKRNQITTESKAHFAFDRLLITDLPQVILPAIKGHQKKGVFDVARLMSVREMIKFLPFVDNVVISVSSFLGFEMACALSRLGKDIILVCSPEGVLAEVFDDDTAALLKQIVEGKNIRVITEPVEEILGDAEVKAVRLKSGKVMAAQMVLLDEGVPDTRLLHDSGILEENQVAVGEFFNTGVEHVFACDAALGAFDLLLEESEAQGRTAAANLLNVGSQTYQPPVLLRDFGAKVCDGFCGGYVRLLDGGREHMKFDGPVNIYKKIFILNEQLAGAVWFNAREDRDKVLKAMVDQSSLAGQEEQFLQSNFPSS